MVESTALEMRRTGNCTVGSNPTLSATEHGSVSANSEGVVRHAVTGEPLSGENTLFSRGNRENRTN